MILDGMCDDEVEVGNMEILEILELATLCDDVMEFSRTTTIFRIVEDVRPTS